MTSPTVLPGNPPARSRRGLVARIILLLVLVLAFVLLTGVLDGGSGVAPLRLFDQPRFLFANAWPGLLLAGTLLMLTRRVLLSLGLTFLLQGLLYGINTLKFANLGTPLLPADFQIASQLSKGGTHLLLGYLPHSPWPYLGLLLAVIVVIALWRYEPPLFARRNRGKRWLTGAVMAALLVSLLAGVSAWGKIYNGKVLWLEPWSASSTTIHSGLVSSLLMFQLHYGHGKQKADPAIASQLISQFDGPLRQHLQTPSTPSDALPDIVVVQSESFFDPKIMKGYEHSHFTPNLSRLSQHGTSGQLHVPTFGGGTIRTEFEVLTGLSLRYFDNLQFPYLELNNKEVPSLVRVLHEHGYSTMAIHGNNPAFWNRTSAFKALGFEHFVSQGDFPANAPMAGKYMADSAMTDEIMTRLKDSGPPQFIFAISIEAHGPYDVEPSHGSAQRDAIPVPAGVTGKDKLELQNYLLHIGHADAELGRLVKLLAKRSRPSLVLFYGDHLPALTNSYHVTGFVDGKDMLSQAGVWLLVDPRTPGKPVQQDTASWLLPGKLLQQVGINDDPYFALTELAGPSLAALTRAPGAPPMAEDSAVKQLDTAMSNVEQLRMRGKLAKLLPKVEPKDVQTGIAHDNGQPPNPPKTSSSLLSH